MSVCTTVVSNAQAFWAVLQSEVRTSRLHYKVIDRLESLGR